MDIILRILAILLGVPAAILLALILLALVLSLIPVRYRVSAETGDDTAVAVTVSYLLHLIHLTYVYAGKESETVIRIAGFRLRDKPEREKREKRERIKFWPSKTKPHKLKRRKKKPEKAKPEKKSLLTTLDEIKAVLTRKDLKIIMGLLFEFIIKVFKYLCPKRLNVSGVVGLDDPFYTGILIGSCEAATGALNLSKSVRLAGDFNEKTLRLNIFAEGRVSAAGMFAPVLWLVTRKPVFKFILERIKKI